MRTSRSAPLRHLVLVETPAAALVGPRQAPRRLFPPPAAPASPPRDVHWCRGLPGSLHWRSISRSRRSSCTIRRRSCFDCFVSSRGSSRRSVSPNNARVSVCMPLERCAFELSSPLEPKRLWRSYGKQAHCCEAARGAWATTFSIAGPWPTATMSAWRIVPALTQSQVPSPIQVTLSVVKMADRLFHVGLR